MLMLGLAAARSAGSPACCENCACGESCPGCPSYRGGATARFASRFASRNYARSGGAMRGLGSITEQIKASPGKFAFGLAVAGLLAYTVTHKSTRRPRRR